MSRLFQNYAELIRIQIKAVPVETPNSITFAERYHEPLQRAFNMINFKSTDLSKEEALQLSIKAINHSVEPDGMVTTLLVYGAIPRLGFSLDRPTPNITQRANDLHKAAQKMSRHFARMKIMRPARTGNKLDTSDFCHASVNIPGLVH